MGDAREGKVHRITHEPFDKPGFYGAFTIAIIFMRKYTIIQAERERKRSQERKKEREREIPQTFKNIFSPSLSPCEDTILKFILSFLSLG
jgi:hypothetical protein